MDADDIGYECTYRYNTFVLGTIAIKYDTDPSDITYCVCSRVLIDCDEQESRNRVKRKKCKKRRRKNSKYNWPVEEDNDQLVNVDDDTYRNELPSHIVADPVLSLMDEQTMPENREKDDSIVSLMDEQMMPKNCENDVVSSAVDLVESTNADVPKKSCCGLFACFNSVVMYVRKKFETKRQSIMSSNTVTVPPTVIDSMAENIDPASIRLGPDYKYNPKRDPVQRAALNMRYKMIAGIVRGKVLGIGYNEFEVEYLNNQHAMKDRKTSVTPRLKVSGDNGKTTPKKARIEVGSYDTTINHVDARTGDVISILTPNKRKHNQHKHIPKEIAEADLGNYWKNRYSLFSKYDSGIRMDLESWFSVTPELVAAHIADVCACETIIDGFCGAGGNTIQFAFKCKRVIAIDIDPHRIELARNNAKVYGVENKIDFIVGDFFEIAPKLKADVVFLSPPWGGPKYRQLETFSMKHMQPTDGKEIFEVASKITNNIAYFLPRNIAVNEIIDLAKPEQKKMEIEQINYQGRLFAICAYFGQLTLNTDDAIERSEFVYQSC